MAFNEVDNNLAINKRPNRSNTARQRPIVNEIIQKKRTWTEDNILFLFAVSDWTLLLLIFICYLESKQNSRLFIC